MVPWLGLCTWTAGGMGSIPGQGTKILQRAHCSHTHTQTHIHTHTHTHMRDNANIFSTKKNSQRLKTNFKFIILELNLFLGKIHFPL